MKKVIVSSILAFVLLFAYGEMVKKVTLSGTVIYAGTHKFNLLDKERVVMVYENMGVRVSNSRECSLKLGVIK